MKIFIFVSIILSSINDICSDACRTNFESILIKNSNFVIQWIVITSESGYFCSTTFISYHITSGKSMVFGINVVFLSVYTNKRFIFIFGILWRIFYWINYNFSVRNIITFFNDFNPINNFSNLSGFKSMITISKK